MKEFRIAKIFGIDIEIHISWFIIFGLLVWFFVGDYLPRMVPGQSQISYWVSGFITTIIFFFSILFHELAHSLTAKRFKIIIERITLFVFGGIAHMSEEPKSAKADFLIAAAGPVSSLFLAGVFLGLTLVGTNAFPALALAGLFWLASINIMLAVFNLVPAFPLDGGRIFRAILWHLFKDELKATKIACYGGQAFGILLIMAGLFLFVFSGDFSSLMWLGFIGWFLFTIAKQSYRQLVIQKTLSQVKVKEIMERGTFFEPEKLDAARICQPEDDLKTILERMRETQWPEFYVMSGGKVIGRVIYTKISQYVRESQKKRSRP